MTNLRHLTRTMRKRSLKALFAVILCICVFVYINNSFLVNVSSEWGINVRFGGQPRLKRLLAERYQYEIKQETSGAQGAQDDPTFGSDRIEKLEIPEIPKYLITPNPSTCAKRVDLLVYVQSAWSNFMKRRYIRNTWAGKNAYRGYNVKTVFILGKPANKNDQVKINNEHLLYGDILEADLTENSRNLSRKCGAALDWISNNCASAEHIMKVDDDVFVNIFRVFEKILPVVDSRHKLILCHVIENGKSPIVRDKASKWYIPLSIFPNRTHLPRFCSGYFAIMTKAVWADLYLHSRTTPSIAVDDVYLFGHLTQGIPGLAFVDLKQNLTLSQAVGLGSYKSGTGDYVGIHVQDNSALMEQLWSLTLNRVYARPGPRSHSKAKNTAKP